MAWHVIAVAVSGSGGDCDVVVIHGGDDDFRWMSQRSAQDGLRQQQPTNVLACISMHACMHACVRACVVRTYELELAWFSMSGVRHCAGDEWWVGLFE